MKTLVTGATGLIGSAVVRALLGVGREVKALVHRRDARNLKGLELEQVTGDLLEPDSLRRALAGCDRLHHLGGIYAHWRPEGPDFIIRVNVEGTRNILAAAVEQGLTRVVHASSISALGFHPDRPSTEADEPTPDELLGQPYRISKWRSELVAREFASKLPLVIVNPASPIGVGDWLPTPTGRTILDFLNGKMFAYVDVGLNLIDVDDMAVGFVAAEAKGRVGERYILGAHNRTLKSFLDQVAEVSGLPAPTVKLPRGLIRLVAEVGERVADRLGREPLVAREQARHLYYNEFADCKKAVTELGLPQNDLRVAIVKAIKYYLELGAVKPERIKKMRSKK